MTTIRTNQDLIQDVKSHYPDEDPDGAFLAPTIAALGKLVSYHTVPDGPDNATGFIIMEPDTTDDDLAIICGNLNLDPEGRTCRHEHDCCGHWYHGRIRAQPYGTSTTGYRIAAVRHYRNV